MKHTRKFRIIAWLAAMTLLLSGCMQKVEDSSSVSSSDVSQIIESSSSEVSSEESYYEPEPEPVTATVTLTAVGDNLIHRPIYEQANARANGNGYDFSYPYEHIADKIAAADIAVYNQETVVAPDYQPSSYPCFNSPRELGERMVEIGFDVASLANNHSFDKGESGLKNCLEFWKTQNIVTTGAYLNEEDYNSVAMYEVEGIKFGFVAFTDPTNGLSLPQGSELTVLLQSNFSQIEEKIVQAKQVCDIVVVIPHWGIEYTTKYTDSQAQVAQKLADCGADIIIGSHPHCIQPIEYITSADGREVPVCYSLGNFISGQTERLRLVGGMVDFTITYDFSEDTFTIDDIDFRPVITHYVGGCKEICNYLYADYSAELAAAHGVKTLSGSSLSLAYIEDLVTSTIDEQYLADDWKP